MGSITGNTNIFSIYCKRTATNWERRYNDWSLGNESNIGGVNAKAFKVQNSQTTMFHSSSRKVTSCVLGTTYYANCTQLVLFGMKSSQMINEGQEMPVVGNKFTLFFCEVFWCHIPTEWVWKNGTSSKHMDRFTTWERICDQINQVVLCCTWSSSELFLWEICNIWSLYKQLQRPDYHPWFICYNKEP